MPRRNDIQKILAIGFAAVVVLLPHPVRSQVDCVSPARIHVPSVKGQVFDFDGAPVPGAELMLVAEGKRPMKLRSDLNGRFDFKAPPGEYTLQGYLSPLEATDIKLTVGKDLLSGVHRPRFDLILGLRWSFCSWATTSRREFQEIIRSNQEKIEESVQRNATQK